MGAGDCYLYTRDSMAAGSPTVTLTTNVGDSFQALAVVPISSTGGFDTSGTIALQTSGNTRTSGTSGTPASSGVAIGFCYNDTNNNGGAVGSGYSALTGTGVTSGKFWNFTVANNFALAEQKSYASGTQAATFDFTANNTSTTGSTVALFKDAIVNPALGSQTATFSQGSFSASTPAIPVSGAALAPLMGNKVLGPLGLGGFALKITVNVQATPGTVGMGTQTATFTQGTFTASSTGSATLGSQTATFSQGTLIASTSGSGTVAIGSQTATFTQGVFSIPGSFTSINYHLDARFPINPNGKVVLVDKASSGTPVTYQNAFKIDVQGRLSTTTVSGAVWQDGFQFDANGNLLITQSPIAPVTKYGGLPFDASGALVVSTNSVVAWQNGLGFDSNGYLCVIFA